MEEIIPALPSFAISYDTTGLEPITPTTEMLGDDVECYVQTFPERTWRVVHQIGSVPSVIALAQAGDPVEVEVMANAIMIQVQFVEPQTGRMEFA